MTQTEMRVAAFELVGAALLRQPDTLLRHQWEQLHRAGALSPAQRLCLAVLEDAVECLRLKAEVRGASSRFARARRVSKRQTIRTDTIAWFESDADGPMSFVWCCDALGLLAPVLRERLRARDWWPASSPIRTSPGRLAAATPGVISQERARLKPGGPVAPTWCGT